MGENNYALGVSKMRKIKFEDIKVGDWIYSIIKDDEYYIDFIIEKLDKEKFKTNYYEVNLKKREISGKKVGGFLDKDNVDEFFRLNKKEIAKWEKIIMLYNLEN